jgi:hypothetical protein
MSGEEDGCWRSSRDGFLIAVIIVHDMHHHAKQMFLDNKLCCFYLMTGFRNLQYVLLFSVDSFSRKSVTMMPFMFPHNHTQNSDEGITQNSFGLSYDGWHYFLLVHFVPGRKGCTNDWVPNIIHVRKFYLSPSQQAMNALYMLRCICYILHVNWGGIQCVCGHYRPNFFAMPQLGYPSYLAIFTN